MRDRFTLLFESVMDVIEDESVQSDYTSFEVFRHFCAKYNLIAELDDNEDADKLRECSLYFMKETESDNKPKRFDYYDYQTNKDYPDIVDALRDFKEGHRVTVDGTRNSPRVIWG